MPTLTRVPRPRRVPRAPRFLSCAVHGHRWDVAPGYRRGGQMECVRCGMRREPVAGLGR